MDDVFKAMNDPSRRLLLDSLFDRDGRTLGELCELLPDMTRFGVMNHLRVLETAGLITTVNEGRRKFHYLNPVPIRQIHDRWISKFTEPVVAGLAALTNLEGDRTMPVPSHRYQTFIAAPVDRVWDAITDGDQTAQYFYRTRVESTWQVGSEIRYLGPDGSVVASGEILAFKPEDRLEMTFLPHWDPDLEGEGPVHMAWIVDQAMGLSRVTVEYYDLDATSKQAGDFMEGLPFIVAGMKTLLETGSPLPMGPAD